MSTSASRMLAFVTPPDVRSSFTIPPDSDRDGGAACRPEPAAGLIADEPGERIRPQVARGGRGRARSEPLGPEVDRVVDLRALVLRQDLLGQPRGELDPDDALEVRARPEGPAHVHRCPAPAAPGPEPL